MTTLTQELVDLLNLERLDDNICRGQSCNLVGKRVFGGQLLAQALRAASYTTDRPAYSMHVYFLIGGDINAPIVYEVDRLRDGKSLVNRQVRAIQHGRLIFTAMISFAHFEAGLEYQEKMPEYPAPETLKNEQELKQQWIEFVPEHIRKNFLRERHVEFRPIHDATNFFHPKPETPEYAHYVRTHEKLEDDTALHQAIIAFYSDFTLMTTALRPHGLSYLSSNLQCASLDHTIYFHHPVRADEWMLYDMHATVTASSRGLNYGKMWQNNKLVCSTVQEGLMRLREVEAQ